MLAAQRPDGGWGAPGSYALVPTLSAVEALLAVLARGEAGGRPTIGDCELVGAVDRGMATLVGWLGDETLRLPDTPAVDLIVPALVEAINRHVDNLPASLLRWRPGTRLGLPPGMSSARLVGVRRLIASGAAVPAKLAHSLEVVGSAAGLPSGIGPGQLGTVGASPAATAAWIAVPGRTDGTVAAQDHLEALALRQGGPVPCPIPITVFERAWILSGLARAGIAFTAHRDLVDSLVSRTRTNGDSHRAGPARRRRHHRRHALRTRTPRYAHRA